MRDLKLDLFLNLGRHVSIQPCRKGSFTFCATRRADKIDNQASQGCVGYQHPLSFRALRLRSGQAPSRNGASGTSDMDGCAARVAARESGDERVQSVTVSEVGNI